MQEKIISFYPRKTLNYSNVLKHLESGNFKIAHGISSSENYIYFTDNFIYSAATEK